MFGTDYGKEILGAIDSIGISESKTLIKNSSSDQIAVNDKIPPYNLGDVFSSTELSSLGAITGTVCNSALGSIDYTEIEKKITDSVQKEIEKRQKTCPVKGGTFGTDIDTMDDCGQCKLWDDCETEHHKTKIAKKKPSPSNSKLYWITNNGERILISEMGDTHLVNTIKLLRRKITIMQSMSEKSEFRSKSNYYELIKEAEKRKLTF